MDYSKFYKEISQSEILKLWGKSRSQKTIAYIHSPFCKSKCSYCLFDKQLFSEAGYRLYYEEYLPKIIKKFTPVLHQIQSYYFGGGTPSLMTLPTMKSLFSLFPNFNILPKVFEIHPGVYSLEQIRLLRHYGFNTIIICVQTLNKGLLKKFNRIPYDYETVKTIIESCQSLGFFVMVDLMIFPHIRNAYNILSEDLAALGDLNPDEISIIADQNHVISQDKIGHYISEIMDFNSKAKYDFSDNFYPVNQSYNELNKLLSMRQSVRLTKSKLDANLFRTSIYPQFEGANDILSPAEASVIGLGSFYNPNMETWSIIDRKIQYIETNDKNTPRYFIQYNDEEQPSTHDLINNFFNQINKHKEPPLGLKLAFQPTIKMKLIKEGNRTIPLYSKDLNIDIMSPVQYPNLFVDEYLYKLGG